MLCFLRGPRSIYKIESGRIIIEAPSSRLFSLFLFWFCFSFGSCFMYFVYRVAIFDSLNWTSLSQNETNHGWKKKSFDKNNSCNNFLESLYIFPICLGLSVWPLSGLNCPPKICVEIGEFFRSHFSTFSTDFWQSVCLRPRRHWRQKLEPVYWCFIVDISQNWPPRGSDIGVRRC